MDYKKLVRVADSLRPARRVKDDGVGDPAYNYEEPPSDDYDWDVNDSVGVLSFDRLADKLIAAPYGEYVVFEPDSDLKNDGAAAIEQTLEEQFQEAGICDMVAVVEGKNGLWAAQMLGEH